MKTILLVEDEFGIAGVLTVLLEDAGYRVFSAANGRQALNWMAEITPDLVITDFMMPLMDGAALGQALRGNLAWKDVPIILMSAVPEATVRQRFDGYTFFLRKPFQTEALIDLTAHIVSGETRA